MRAIVPTLLLAATALASPLPQIKADLDARALHPREQSSVYYTAGLITYSTADTRTWRGALRRRIVALGVSADGDVCGHVLKRNGTYVCGFAGRYDGACLTLSGCLSGTSCE